MSDKPSDAEVRLYARIASKRSDSDSAAIVELCEALLDARAKLAALSRPQPSEPGAEACESCGARPVITHRASCYRWEEDRSTTP